ncbi:MAG TPA: regulatory protein RecX [Flavobacteriales bacterium]
MPSLFTLPQVLAKARNYCARQERAQQEVRDKLFAWEVPYTDIEPIIGQLIAEGFLNEARFAEHFAVSKARQKGWGATKIEAALKQKQVSAPCIRAALKAIDQEEQEAQLKKLVAKRWEKEKDPKIFLKRQKVMAYFLRRGFSVEQIVKALPE